MISTHILDTSSGNPAADVPVDLFEIVSGRLVLVESGKTDADGRIKFEVERRAGSFHLVFNIDQYFSDSFFDNPRIGFHIKETNRNYHIPLLLNPFGYTTYRGS